MLRSAPSTNASVSQKSRLILIDGYVAVWRVSCTASRACSCVLPPYASNENSQSESHRRRWGDPKATTNPVKEELMKGPFARGFLAIPVAVDTC
jgi:hypothetical protein